MMLLGFLESIEMGMSWSLLVDRVSEPECNAEPLTITDAQLLRESGDVHIDSTDIGMSDHFLVWLELGRQLDGGVLISLMMMLNVEALQAEVEALSEGWRKEE